MRAAYAVDTAARVIGGQDDVHDGRELARCHARDRQIGQPPLLELDAEDDLQEHAQPEHRQRDQHDVLRVTSMSQNEYRLIADILPAAMPKIISMMMAASASLSVFGNFSSEDLGHRAPFF